MYFNSTMVRLGDMETVKAFFTAHISIPLWFDWESLPILNLIQRFTISIPLWFDWEKNAALSFHNFGDFNSTMVRLGELWFAQNKMIAIIFQFHYGSIGRLRKQIVTMLKQISIPLWFDWENRLRMKYIKRFIISIPLWFDWETVPFVSILTCPTYFNSTMVRLGEGLTTK